MSTYLCVGDTATYIHTHIYTHIHIWVHACVLTIPRVLAFSGVLTHIHTHTYENIPVYLRYLGYWHLAECKQQVYEHVPPSLSISAGHLQVCVYININAYTYIYKYIMHTRTQFLRAIFCEYVYIIISIHTHTCTNTSCIPEHSVDTNYAQKTK